MTRRLTTLSIAVIAVLGLGASLQTNESFGQQATKPGDKQTWLSISDYVARPDGVAVPIAGGTARGILSLTNANGRSAARYVEVPPSQDGSARRPSSDPRLTEPLGFLSAYVVLQNGNPDPEFGAGPRDMVILTTSDGRIVVSFTDFSADPEGHTYAMPPILRGTDPIN